MTLPTASSVASISDFHEHMAPTKPMHVYVSAYWIHAQQPVFDVCTYQEHKQGFMGPDGHQHCGVPRSIPHRPQQAHADGRLRAFWGLRERACDDSFEGSVSSSLLVAAVRNVSRILRFPGCLLQADISHHDDDALKTTLLHARMPVFIHLDGPSINADQSAFQTL
eukprot:6214532-Pleurochrysis_carterae.AAC.2